MRHMWGYATVYGGYMAADVSHTEVEPPPADWLASINRGARPENRCCCKADFHPDADSDRLSSENQP